MQKDMLEALRQAQEKTQLTALLRCNQKTAALGLTLTEADALLLLAERKETLRQQERLEFGEGILPAIIDAFCGSSYLTQESYRDTLLALQDIFYEYKNESLDLLTDQELLSFMAQQFEEICFGDLEYLRSTCLERFCRAIRRGDPLLRKERDEYALTESRNPYQGLEEETRWDRELFFHALDDLF